MEKAPTPSTGPTLSPGGSGTLLQPSYSLALAIVALALGVLGLTATGLAGLIQLPPWISTPWPGLVLAVFGLFLLLQTSLLRLEFGEADLLVWRQQTLLRRFPYGEWLEWKIFWPALPVLFYFREQRSIHLLPVLFDATGLREQLVQRLGAQPGQPGQQSTPEPSPPPSDV